MSKIRALFSVYTNGVQTKKDEWIYSRTKASLDRKLRSFSRSLEEARRNQDPHLHKKWDRELKRRWESGSKFDLEADKMLPAAYRPFSVRCLGFSDSLISVMFSMENFIEARSGGSKIECICFHGKSAEQPFAALAAFSYCRIALS